MVIDLSSDNAVAAPEVDCLHPAGRTEDALNCHRSCHRKPVFRRWAAYLYLRAAILRRRAMSVGFGDRQPCPRRSRHSSDGVARYPRGRGTACSRSLQALNHNAGILPPDRTPQTSLAASVESGMRLTRLNLLGMILLPQDLLSRAEGDLGIDRQRDLIGALPRARFPAPPMPPASRLTVACSL